MAVGIGDLAGPDKAMGLVYHDMVLVAVVWYGNIHAAFGRTLFLPGVSYRPACACIFLRVLSGLSRIWKG